MNENENKTTGIEEGQVPTENTATFTEPAGNEATPPNENITTAPAAATAKENTAPTMEAKPAPAEPAVTENTASTENKSATGTEFTLTTVQLMDEIGTKLAEHTHPSSWDSEYMIPDFYFEDLMPETVVVRCSKTWQLMGIPYSMNGDNVVLDYENIKRMKVAYEDWDEGEVMPGTIAAFTTLTDKIAELSDSFTKAANEVSEIKPKLEAYQQAEAEAIAAADKAKRDELFSIMDEKLGANEEYTALKENKEISYADLETKCYALVGRRSAEFSYVPNTNNKGTVRFGVGGTQNGSDNAVYGGLMEHYLGK